MHCPNCGTLLPEGAKFCTNCGQPLPVNGEQAPAEEQPAAEPVNETASEDGTYVPPENASSGYKAAAAQLPPSYSNPNYSGQPKANYATTTSGPSNGLAIAGFVCSLILFPIGLGALAAIAGLVLSILGLNSAKTLPENKGRGLALAGAIISGIRIAILLILIFAFLALAVRGVGHVGHEIFSNWKDYIPYSY